MDSPEIDTFIEWFQSNGGSVDIQAMGITEFPGSGRGAIALRDIPEGYTLFTIPRTLTLSTRTSPLPSLFGFEAWLAHGLHKGWVGLILCMMWEDAWAHELDVMDEDGQGKNAIQTKWGPYIRTLPTMFDTPMFWSDVELKELEGTAVVDKLGRDDAERAYSEQLVPAIKTSPTLFPPSHYGKWYTLDAYHRAGSRILSRSFTFSRWTDSEGEENEGRSDEVGSDTEVAKVPDAKAPVESSMSADDAHLHFSLLEDNDEDMNSNSEDDEERDPSNVAMVPMADLLNAKWGNENAKLFYEPIVLRMVTTKNITQGEQIYNTYGDLPNSDLLRRYGHVDLVQLHSRPSFFDRHGDVEIQDSDTDAEKIEYMGNPSDVVEIQADMIVQVVQTTNPGSKAKDSYARIEWWLDEGGDDSFVLSLDQSGSHLSMSLPPALISFIRLLILSEADFNSARSKGKLPKGKLQNIEAKDKKQVLEIIDEVLSRRQGMYAGGRIEDDECLLSTKTLTRRKQYAVIVRLGEKRILKNVRQTVGRILAELSSTSGTGCKSRKDEERETQRGDNDGRGMGSSRKHVVDRTEGNRGWKKARK